MDEQYEQDSNISRGELIMNIDTQISILTVLTGWKDCSDPISANWPPQCGEGTPQGRGQHQHNHTGEV